MMPAAPLPGLSADEVAHSPRLVDRIRDEIDAHDGWISFERYMQMALYEPGLGYDSAGATKLGAAGDFVTAPVVPPLFSRCLASQCVEVFALMKDAAVLELGRVRASWRRTCWSNSPRRAVRRSLLDSGGER